MNVMSELKGKKPFQFIDENLNKNKREDFFFVLLKDENNKSMLELTY